MVEVKKYQLPPTDLVPNSPNPILHYPDVLNHPDVRLRTPAEVHSLFISNGWKTQWIFRYGPTQASHFHSRVHEVMAVLSGSATIRFGVADTHPDLDENTHGPACEAGGVEVHARAGDVFVLPAGTAHKTFDTAPAADFTLLTPGDGHKVAAEDIGKALAGIELSGFTMMGAYPVDGGAWDFAVGGEMSRSEYETVWSVPKPARDPVLGLADAGLAGQWETSGCFPPGTTKHRLHKL